MAVAHSIMTIVYHLLTRKQVYQELGGDYFEIRQQERIVKQTVSRLEKLGYTVMLSASTAS